MENFDLIADYLSRNGEAPATRNVIAVWSPTVQRAYRLFCFAAREPAEAFARHFDGILFDPKRDRKNGSSTGAWHRTDDPTMPDRCGPLVMPGFFREHP